MKKRILSLIIAVAALMPCMPISHAEEAKIVIAEQSDGNTVVTLTNITEGILIGARYNGGVLSDMKTAEIKGNKAIIEDFEADKVFVWNSLDKMMPICPAIDVSPAQPITPEPITEAVTIDFTSMDSVPVYSAENGSGFVTKSGAIMPSGSERTVAPAENITLSSAGASVTETTGSYLHAKTNSNDGDDYNYGGLIYRIDTGAAGAYRLEVEVTGTKSDTRVAPSGMDANRLTSTSNWDNAGNVARTVSASWTGSTWTYDFATGEDFVEIEIEPTALASESEPKTVGVKKIMVTPLSVNAAGDKPTIHILGDSTQKTYTFNETISSWGQTLRNYFDKDKVNVINYSMGGRAMKSNYNEGRFNEILINGKENDFVFIHSAHNDETISKNRFSRGSGIVKDNLAANNESYNEWLDMYVEAIKARGMIPVLVTAMPRTGSGKYSESSVKPNGFNPDAPGNMRAKAASDENVGIAELYDGAKKYIDLLDAKEVNYIYNTIEAGETPAENSANGANGDGTHYREAAAKQWCRIILQSIYDQSVASEDTYTDKAIMNRLVELLPDSVKSAAQSGDWSAVFPEMASDVSAAGIVPGAVKQSESNYYYRNNIEKALQLGLLHKNSSNLFKPTDIITVGEYARGVEKAFGLAENSLTSYTKTYAELGAVQQTGADNAVLKTSHADNNTVLESAVSPMADGEYTVTVTQPVGGTVTVYNESAFNATTADIPSGVTANQHIADNSSFILEAPATVTSGTDKSGVFADNSGVSINYVEFRNSDSKEFIYTAKADGVLTVYARTGPNKPIELVNTANSKEAQSKYIDKNSAESNVYGSIKFDVKANTTYKLYTRAGSGRLFGVKYESTNYPQSTQSLIVNANDTVRVFAAPAENYVNKSIVVNGSEVSNSKEYTFTVTGDTTVTAVFTAEPAMVDVTNVASDAALTREVMGAILYDAYQLVGNKTIILQYMNQNGGVPSPDDPNYDPNIQYEGSPYIPTTGWGALTDRSGISDDLYSKVKSAYNLGLMRPETGIARGSIALGTELEPKAEVTRAKAAKSLVFAFTLTQPLKGESQTLPDGINHGYETAEIAAPNPDAPSTVIK